MNAARQLVRDLIRDVASNWNVISEPRSADAVVKPTALVWVPNITRTDYNHGSYVVSTVDVWLLPPSSLNPAALEDAADDMLADALEAIEAEPSITWTEARRERLEDLFHGWHLILTVAHQITT